MSDTHKNIARQSTAMDRRGAMDLDYKQIGIIILLLALALIIFLIWQRMSSSVFGGG